MNQKSHDYENALCEALHRQRDNYAEASDLTARLKTHFENGQDAVGVLGDLSIVLQRIGQVDEQMRRIQQAWSNGPTPVSPRVRELASHNRIALESLLRQIRSAEELAQKAKDRLAPELDARTRGLQMRKAYSSVGRVG